MTTRSVPRNNNILVVSAQGTTATDRCVLCGYSKRNMLRQPKPGDVPRQWWRSVPSGMFEQDDMDNWRQCTESGRSIKGKQVMQYLSMGLGHDKRLDGLPGTAGGHWVNEVPQREVYRRWQEFMDAESWADIHLDPRTAAYEGTARFKG